MSIKFNGLVVISVMDHELRRHHRQGKPVAFDCRPPLSIESHGARVM